MNTYEQKQADRRERMAARVDRLRAYAAREYDKADLREEKSGIPFGQPILIGHHSEGKHRRALRRADEAMRRAVDATKAANRLEATLRRAETSSAVSSDDPDAIAKLQAEVSKLEADQARMKAANKLVRKKDAAGLVAMGFTEKQAGELLSPDFCGRLGFTGYMTANNSANIRRIKERIKILETNQTRGTKETVKHGVRVVENADDNRLQLFFDGKPADDVRNELKRSGFRWAPSVGAWQRQLNNSARWAAECVLRRVTVPTAA